MGNNKSWKWRVTTEHVFILWEFQCRHILITLLKRVQYCVHVCLKAFGVCIARGYCVVSSERLHVLGGCLLPHILQSTGLEGSLSEVLQRIMGLASLTAAHCNLQR